ncbi:COG5 [Candida theae]|uniref:Conserved oligomeric Golgi complex subunit 5 n=1 Tax=Candida theae TaxID=1198502 RepID=A0AAD5BCR3_9ASCO|nr:COG5 [Candida theae]KAI5955570.1 COG5 [Candida theae]
MTSNGSQRNELEDFEAYLEPDFDAKSFANSLLISTNGHDNNLLDLQTPLKKLKYDLVELDKRMKSISSTNYESLTLNFTQIEQYRTILQDRINPRIDTINKPFEKIKKEVIEPYEDAVRLNNALKNVHQTLELLRATSFFIFLIQQLEELQGGVPIGRGDDVVRASRLYTQLMSLYQSVTSINGGAKSDHGNNVLSIKLIRDYRATAVTRRQSLVQECSMTINNETCRSSSLNLKNLKLYHTLQALYILDPQEFYQVLDKSTIQRQVTTSSNQLSKALQSPRNFMAILTEVQENNTTYFSKLDEVLNKWSLPQDSTNKSDESLLSPVLSYYRTESLMVLFWQKLAQQLKRNIVATMARGGPIAKNLRVYSQGLKTSVEEKFTEEVIKSGILDALSMIEHK